MKAFISEIICRLWIIFASVVARAILGCRVCCRSSRPDEHNLPELFVDCRPWLGDNQRPVKTGKELK